MQFQWNQCRTKVIGQFRIVFWKKLSCQQDTKECPVDQEKKEEKSR